MNEFQIWRKEHEQIRKQCLVIESILSLGQSAWGALRDECENLICKLETHIQHEDQIRFEKGNRCLIEGCSHEEAISELKLIMKHLRCSLKYFDMLSVAFVVVIERLKEDMEIQEVGYVEKTEDVGSDLVCGLHGSWL